MADAGTLVIEIGDRRTRRPVWAYRPETASSSATSPRSSRELAAAPASLKASGTPPADDLVPAPEQAAAVRAAFASRLSIVTGGPGTGKTATIRLICAAAARAEGLGAARRPDRPRRAPDVRVERPRRLHRPLRTRLDPRPGPDRRGARHRPPDRRRDLDGQPRAARHAPARGRPGHARRPRRRRRPARAGRSRQALRRARRGPAGPDRRAHPHLPPGRGKHDRPRRPRRPHGRPAVVRRRRRR